MSKITKMVNIADFRCLSRKIIKTCRCEPIPLTKLDANKVRPLNEHLDQWDFYNREALIQKQKQAEQAKMRANLKAQSKFTMNLLPDYSNQVKKNKDDKDASILGKGANKGDSAAKKLNDKVSKRASDDNKHSSDSSKHGSDSRKRGRNSSKRGRDSSKRGRDSSKRSSDPSNRRSGPSKRGSDSSKRGSDSSNSDSESSKRGSDSRKRGRDSSKRGSDSSKRGSDSSNSASESSKRGSDSRKRGRDSSKRGRDSSKYGRDSSKRSSDPSNRRSGPSKRGSDSINSASESSKRGSESSKLGRNSSRRRNTSRKHRNDCRRRESDSRPRSDSGTSEKKAWENPLGKTLEFLTTEEYKRISPEFLKLLQERQLAKKSSTSKHRARWKEDMLNNMPTIDKNSLDTLTPTLAQYLRDQMEDGNIMNQIYGIDFYRKNMNEDPFTNTLKKNPYSAMNLHELKKVLKTLKTGGTLSKDELKFLYTFLESAAEMDSENFEGVMRFSISLGIFSPKMVDYLKALMLKTNANLTPENLNNVLTSLGAPVDKVDFPRFIRRTRVFPERTYDVVRRQHEEVDEAPIKKKKGYIYPTSVKNIVPDEPEVVEVEEETVPKFSARPDKKNDYFNFRIDRSQTFRRGHPPGYYEPIAVDEFVLAGLSDFERLSTAPRASTLSKLSQMKQNEKKIQPVSPKYRNSLERKSKIKRTSSSGSKKTKKKK